MSFTKDVIKKHEPTTKQIGGTMIDPTVKDAIDSRNKAMAYPIGFFQSNGNLQTINANIENIKLFFFQFETYTIGKGKKYESLSNLMIVNRTLGNMTPVIVSFTTKKW